MRRETIATACDAAREKFVTEMDDDFNTLGPWAVFELRAPRTRSWPTTSDIGVAGLELIVNAETHR